MRLGFLERILLGLALTATLTIALARSPLWHGADIVASPLPARYAELLQALPGEPHTALAFIVLIILVNAGLLVPRHPLLIPSIVTAFTLSLAAYPWSIIRWHEIFPDFFGLPRPLTPLDWVFLALPVLLLTATPALLQIRATLQHYQAKQITQHELHPIRRHLSREATLLGTSALGLTLLAGVLLAAARGLPAPGFLRENALLVLLAAGLLVIAAILIGTRILGSSPSKAGER